MKRGTARWRLVVMVLVLGIFLPSVCAQPVERWNEIRSRLERVDSERGRQEVAKEVGYQWVSANHTQIGLAAQGLEYLIDASSQSGLAQFNQVMTRVGGVLILAQVAYEISQGRPGGEILKNLATNSGFFAAALAKAPTLNFIAWATLAFKFTGDMLADTLYTADDKIWWDLYQDFFLTGPGKLSRAGWLGLFEGKTTDRFTEHMDGFFTQEGKLYAQDRRQEFERTGRRVPRVADPEDAPVRKLAEAFRLRYYQTHLQKQMAIWALAEAEREVQREIANLRAELAKVLEASRVLVKVVDANDGAPVQGAFVEVSFQGDRGPDERYGKTGEDGLVDLRGVPPWAQGTLSVEARGYLVRRENDVEKFVSSADQPRPVTVEITPGAAKLAVVVVDATNGSPVAGARVNAVPTARGTPVAISVGGNGQGTMEFPRLGEYAFTVEAPGFATLERLLTVDARGGGPETFRLVAGGKGVQVSVLVRDAKTGKPLDRVEVTCRSGDRSASGVSGPTGAVSLTLSGSTGGAVQIGLTREGYAAQALDRPVVAGKVSLTAALEGEAAGVRVLVKDQSTNAPLPGVKVSLAGGGSLVRTDGQGVALLPASGADPVSVTCSLPGFKPGKATLRQGEAEVTVMLVPEVALLTVKVGNKATMEPLAKVRVRATVNGVERAGETDAYGSVKLEIPAGDTVKVNLSKDGFQAIEVEKPIKDRQVAVSGTLSSTGGGTLAVTIKDKATKRPLAGVTVKAGGVSVVTDREGKASLVVEPGLELTIVASADGYETRTDTGTGPAVGQAKAIGWYLERLAAKPPEPAPVPPKAAAGGGNTPFCGIYQGHFFYDPGVVDDLNARFYGGRPRFQGGLDTESVFTLEVVRQISHAEPKSAKYPWDGIYQVRIKIQGEVPSTLDPKGTPFAGEGEAEVKIAGSGVEDNYKQFTVLSFAISSFAYGGKPGKVQFFCRYVERETGLYGNIRYEAPGHGGDISFRGKP
ncbi:MAG: hypothetical protein GX442_14345 [Candidatus Riflebacteria bacterium]|nr:hypothetical protein [Candidatus Riflebacteria bacterium]